MVSAPRLILASRSPQRRAILTQLGLEFEVVVPDVDEVMDGDPAELVVENARRKAVAVAAGQRAGGDGATVLGVDTVVVVDRRAYGKPVNEVEAEATLRMLAGRQHDVLSGMCVITTGDGEPRTAVAVTTVRFRPLDERVLAWYLKSGEWQDRAGGYAIQGRGAALVATIEGDYLNVVGLPVGTLQDLIPGLIRAS
jgi:septum formation protein